MRQYLRPHAHIKGLTLGTALLLPVLSACTSKSNSSDSNNTAQPKTTSSTGTEAATSSATATSNHTSTGHVEESSAPQVSLTGTLALADLGLVESARGVLAFKVIGGRALGDPAEVAVDAEGRFSVTVTRADEAVDLLVGEMAKERSARDWAGMAEAAKTVVADAGEITAEVLQSMSDDELNQGITDLARSMQSAGPMTLLVAYQKSGDLVQEAESFRFISMPTESGGNLAGLPNAELKGSLDFGLISGSGSEIQSALSSAAAFNLSASTIDALAEAGKALKMVKNIYMNDEWTVSPFYFWTSGTTATEVIDQFSDVNLSSYHGYGFYMPNRSGGGLTLEDLCGQKSLVFTPPAPVAEKSDGGNLSTVASYTNAGGEIGSQGDSRVCQANGYYAREDVEGGQTSFMLNFGTGGSIQDSPEGLWRLVIDGVEEARFDLAQVKPVVEGKPRVLLPSAKFTTTSGKVTGVTVELYRWSGSAFVKVTDMTPVKKLFSEISASISRASDNAEIMARLSINDDASLTGVFDGGEQRGGESINPPVDVDDVRSFAVSYNIGDASYRMEYRNPSNSSGQGTNSTSSGEQNQEQGGNAQDGGQIDNGSGD